MRRAALAALAAACLLLSACAASRWDTNTSGAVVFAPGISISTAPLSNILLSSF